MTVRWDTKRNLKDVRKSVELVFGMDLVVLIVSLVNLEDNSFSNAFLVVSIVICVHLKIPAKVVQRGLKSIFRESARRDVEMV